MAQTVYAMRGGKMVAFGILGMPGSEDYVLQRIEGKLVAVGLRPEKAEPEAQPVPELTGRDRYASDYAQQIRSLLRDCDSADGEKRTSAEHVDREWWAKRLAEVEPA